MSQGSRRAYVRNEEVTKLYSAVDTRLINELQLSLCV